MPLWLDSMLEEPALCLRLVAGDARCRTRGPARWVHISELPDPSPWLQGGELLLTTGYVLARSVEAQRRFVQLLDEAGCVGLVVSLGLDGAVPEGLLEEARSRGFPLLTTPHEFPLMAITSWVSDFLNEERNTSLRQAVQMHRGMLRAVLQGEGLNGVVERAGSYLPDFGFLLFDYYGRQLAEQSWNATLPEPAEVFRVMAAPLRTDDRARSVISGTEVTGAVVRLTSQVEAVLVAAGSRRPQEHELLLFEQALTGVGIELARLRSFRLERRRQVGELFADITAGIVDDRAVQVRLRRLGVDPAHPFQILCVHSPAEADGHALATLVEESAEPGTPGLVGTLEGELFWLVSSADPGRAHAVVDAAAAKGIRDVRVGRSQPRTGVGEIMPAVREARLCATAHLEVPTAVRDVAAIGVPGLVAGLHSHPAIRAFVDRFISPLSRADTRDGSQLLHTVRTYLRHGCRPGPAAGALHIHRHTLSYRLDRVRKLTGCDLRDGDAFLSFGLALEAYDQGFATADQRPRDKRGGERQPSGSAGSSP